jgi:hypothetical protein
MIQEILVLDIGYAGNEEKSFGRLYMSLRTLKKADIHC